MRHYGDHQGFRHETLGPAYFALTFALSWGGALLDNGGFGGMRGITSTSEFRFVYVMMAMLAGPSAIGILLTVSSPPFLLGVFNSDDRASLFGSAPLEKSFTCGCRQRRRQRAQLLHKNVAVTTLMAEAMVMRLCRRVRRSKHSAPSTYRRPTQSGQADGQ
jgi:hypothetical protein